MPQKTWNGGRKAAGAILESLRAGLCLRLISLYGTRESDGGGGR